MEKHLKRRYSDAWLYKTALASLVVLASATIGAMLVLAYFSFIDGRGKVIEYYNEPFPTDKKEYAAGERIIYKVEYHKFQNVSGKSVRQIICDNGDGTFYNSPGIAGFSSINKTPDDVKSQTVDVDAVEMTDKAPLNKDCYINIIIQYDTNFLKQPVVVAHTQLFRRVK